MTIRYLSPPNLHCSIFDWWQSILQDRSRGVGAKVPPWTLFVISLCTQPHSRTDIVNKLSQRGGQIFDQFIDIGILIPEHQLRTDVPELCFHTSTQAHAIDERSWYASESPKKDSDPTKYRYRCWFRNGCLAVYAALAGASKVYAIENSEMVDQIAQVQKTVVWRIVLR